MNSNHTYLYYPFIKIPESTLVDSLLFHDRVKRIIPPQHAGDEDLEQAYTQKDICKQYLGYEFIEEADYSDSRAEISGPFCALLDDALKAKSPKKFEQIFGKNYKSLFDFERTTIWGTQYFIYAQKFDEQVYNKLLENHWMVYHEDMHACELRNELCNVYMTLLAGNIGRRTGEPISTGVREAEELLRKPIFQEYFRGLVSDQLRPDTKLQEMCVSLILGGGFSKDSEGVNRSIPIDKVLTFPEAVRIRAGLEKERKEFCSFVDNLMARVKAIDPADPKALLELEVRDVIDAATNYWHEIQKKTDRELKNGKKEWAAYIQTGISVSLPVLGTAADVLTNKIPEPGFWTSMGTLLSLFSFALLHKPSRSLAMESANALSSREKAYLFMNRLWEIRDRRIGGG